MDLGKHTTESADTHSAALGCDKCARMDETGRVVASIDRTLAANRGWLDFVNTIERAIAAW